MIKKLTAMVLIGLASNLMVFAGTGGKQRIGPKR